jgi:polysaccharide biosynthesis/export protein
VISFKKHRHFLLAVIVAALLSSCGALNQNIMFKTEGPVMGDSLADVISRTQKNYIVRNDDYLELQVFTNNGERLVDPNQEMAKQLGGGQNVVTAQQGSSVKYLVGQDGKSKLPLVGFVKVQGYTMRQLDSLLQIKYSEYYEDAFVVSKVVNKRVFVLGNAGGKTEVEAKVIPLENENMSVIEVLTIAGGLDYMAKSNKIRLVRGDLKNPNVYVIDLSTIEGVRKSHLNVQPNDIIYVERQRRVLSQLLSELTPIIMFTNTLLLIYISTRTRL